jgi:pimeloyl-ACP methyl ester carboxylesterase
VRCIAYDRRGHGRSDDPGRGYDFPALASDLATIIERLDLQGVTLVGYSMGSAETIHYISRYGKDRISRLVLVSPIAPARGEHSMIDDFIAALKKDRPAAMSAGLSLFLGQNSTVSPALAQWVLEQFLQSSPKAIIECQRAIAAEDHQPLLKSLTIPTLIIQGDKDDWPQRPNRVLATQFLRTELASQAIKWPGQAVNWCFASGLSSNFDCGPVPEGSGLMGTARITLWKETCPSRPARGCLPGVRAC